jgi:adenine-specific DNA methylase
MHKWWARRLGVIFRMLLISHVAEADTSEEELWERFYGPHALPVGFTVLDPFLGGGTTLVEAAKQGATCLGCDIDPVACFITAEELTASDPAPIRDRFAEIEGAVAPRIRRLYRTRVAGREVDAVYSFWVDRVRCPGCGTERDAHPTYQLAHDREKGRQTVICPHCDAVADLPLDAKQLRCGCGRRTDLAAVPMEKGKFRCPDCDSRTPLHELWRTGAARPRLFAQEYLDAAGNRGFAPIGPTGLRRYAEAEAFLAAEERLLLLPAARIPSEGRADRRPLLYGYATYREMFNARQLYCLGLIGAEVAKTADPAVRRALALAFSHSLASNNMFCGYAFGYRRLTPLFSVHAFRKISRPVEGHVWGLPIGRGSFANAVRALLEGKEYMRRPFEYRYEARRPERVTVALPQLPAAMGDRPVPPVRILNQSAADLSAIASGSVDLILTDPPYFDNLSYSELSDFYHVWLRKLLGTDYPGHAHEHTPIGSSLFAGKRASAASESPAPDAHKAYAKTLARVFLECRRVAKPRAGMLFTYHHRSAEAWKTLGRAIIPAGFEVLDVFPVRSEGRSGFHSYGGSIKWDSVLVCRHGPLPAYRATTGQGVAAAVRWAAAAAARWVARLSRAKLSFGEMDYQSLLMSLVLRRFSQQKLRPAKLSDALAKALCEPIPKVFTHQ